MRQKASVAYAYELSTVLTRAQIREVSRMLDGILEKIYNGTLSSDGPVAAALVTIPSPARERSMSSRSGRAQTVQVRGMV